MDVSAEAVASKVLFAEKSQASTVCECPVNVANKEPLETSHSL
jgi:hypothetical protein